MPALAEYVDVYNSALNTISKKGFQIWYDDPSELFCAERDGWDFMADTPISLLGLIAIFEMNQVRSYSGTWWRDEGDFDYQALPSRPRPYLPVAEEGAKQTLGSR